MCECCTSSKDIYLPVPAEVKETKVMNETELYLRLDIDGDFDYMPGQFVEVSLAGYGEAPISISSSPTFKDGIELVVRKIGSVTNRIHQLASGDKVGIRGPLGEGCYPAAECKGQDLVFICGGIGYVPQRSFINYVLDNREDYGEVTILQGTKTADMRIYKDELAELAKRDDITLLETVDQADESWKGNEGVITTLIPEVESKLKGAKIFVCGPPIMYKFVLLALEERDVQHEDIYLNLERKMKCGVGKCGHCQINDKYVCMDGPVFKFSELNSTPEAI